LIELAQIGVAVLLCWRKTALPAACAAGLVVFRCGRQWSWHDFEVDPGRNELRIREVWLRKDTPLLFSGTCTLTGDRLTIRGAADSSAPAQLSLTRIPNR